MVAAPETVTGPVKYVNAKNWRSHIFAFAVFCLLAIIYTWPLASNITRLHPSLQSLGGTNDPSFFIGYIDIVTRGLTGDNVVATETMIMYPRGIDMLGAYDGPLLFVVAIPANLIFGNPVLAYNLAVMAGFLFTAMGMYFLVRHLIGSSLIGTIGGAFYGFSAYMLIRGLAHLNLMMLGVVPLFALVAVKFARNPTTSGALSLFFLAALSALSSWYYALAGSLFVTIIFLAHWRSLWEKKRLSFLAMFSLALGLFIVAVPLLSSENKGSMPMSDEFAFKASAQLQNLFVPTPASPVFGSLTSGIYTKFPTVLVPEAPNLYEMTSYLGVIGLLAAAAFVFQRKLARPDVWWWSLSALIFLILSLGPYLYVFGHKIYLPFYLLRRIYPFDLFRVPNRFFIITLLCCVVLAMYLLDYLLNKIPARRGRALLLAGVCLVFFMDSFIMPYPLMTFPVPDFYNTIGRDQGKYAIADLPIQGFAVYNYYQTTHHKPIVDGHFFYPGMSPMTYAFVSLNSLLSGARCGKSETAAIDYKPETALSHLSKANVKYVVVHNLLIKSQPECVQAGEYVRRSLAGRKPIYADGDITVYATE